MKLPTIIGAGLSGLITAYQFPSSYLLDASSREHSPHKAVLRFRTDALSRLTGIPFRSVTVRKSIWNEGQHVLPNLQLANQYSIKTNGSYRDRSIWNLDAVQRFIAPEDLLEQMRECVKYRTKWECPVDKAYLINMSRPLITTMPMPAMLEMIWGKTQVDFKWASIEVDRYRVSNCDVFQTVYFPDPDLPVYRASITGSLLIVERSAAGDCLEEVMRAFGIASKDVSKIETSHHQKYGKIQPIDDALRRELIYRMTIEHGIYSIGRFAVWRNILLDDVVDDAAVVKRLINQGHYTAALHHHRSN